ncbi:MAG TPA: CDP-alcohol phosphatidyltransferase family protein [Puia sp.]|jgi:CDP-diacylglycerol--glycerol-3-phosphate 3-phosphatidyltransferase|nr:CDP-alcohol phosphatidyltransferase family protein [Puia sp.]
MKKQRPVYYYIVNVITLWRLLAAPLVIYLAFQRQLELFKWFLAVSFLTDAIDGFLARRYRVTSTRGAILDSIGDDLTVGAAVAGVFVFKMEFVRQESVLIIVLTALYVLQVCLSLIRYRKMSSFHTYLAKLAAILQAVFLLLLFFLPGPVLPLFYLAAVATILDLVEEIVLVLLLRQWEANVKGLYWVLKKRRLGRRGE